VVTVLCDSKEPALTETTVKQLLLLALFCFAAFKGWNHYQSTSVAPLYTAPYVAVYGRDSCSITQRMLKDLRAQSIRYEYHRVDDKAVADTLHERMNSAGISTRRYNLPVVDVSGHIEVRPSSKQVVKRLQL
jgi:hypothetical protein